jgi:hypothetical protein
MATLKVPSAEAKTMLADHLGRGEQLLLSASWVGDRDDFGVWHRRRKDWIRLTSDALAKVYEGAGVVREFQHSAKPSPHVGGQWQEHLSAEFPCIRDAIETLSSLFERLQSEPS